MLSPAGFDLRIDPMLCEPMKALDVMAALSGRLYPSSVPAEELTRGHRLRGLVSVGEGCNRTAHLQSESVICRDLARSAAHARGKD